MNPFDFFNNNQSFPFKMHPQFSPEYLQDIRQMVKQYQAMFNEDFWKNISNLNQNGEIQRLPIEIWENDDFIFLMVIAPGLNDLDETDVYFQSDQLLTLFIKSHTVKPETATVLLKSELPKGNYEREIYLPKPVKTMDYSVSQENGILTYIFKKTIEG